MITEDDYNAMAGPDWPLYREFVNRVNVPQFVLDEIAAMTKESDFEIQKYSSFCAVPFYAVEYPANISCCLMKNGRPLDKIKQDMLESRRPPECSTCWRIEDAGNESDRMIKNSMFDHAFKRDIVSLAKECLDNNNQTLFYKVTTSNVCNAACVTCGSKASSTWGKIEKKHNIVAAPLWQIYPDDINIDYSSAKFISFLGGEPTLSKTNFDILEKLLDHNNNSCSISFITNGSFTLGDYQRRLLKEFKNLDFCFSVDGINSVFEYMRYPLAWQDILDNIEYCKREDILVSASFTVSNVNLFYYDQTVNWFKQNNIKHNLNLVYNPVYFAPGSLSEDIKTIILSNNPGLARNNFLRPHAETDDIEYQNFKDKIAEQDILKGISIVDYMPDFWKHIQ